MLTKTAPTNTYLKQNQADQLLTLFCRDLASEIIFQISMVIISVCVTL